MQTVCKSLDGGFIPLSAVLVHQKIFDALQPNLEFWLEGILSKLILLHVQLVLQPKRLSKGITY